MSRKKSRSLSLSLSLSHLVKGKVEDDVLEGKELLQAVQILDTLFIELACLHHRFIANYLQAFAASVQVEWTADESPATTIYGPEFLSRQDAQQGSMHESHSGSSTPSWPTQAHTRGLRKKPTCVAGDIWRSPQWSISVS